MIAHYGPALATLAAAVFVALGCTWTLVFLTLLVVAVAVAVRAEVRFLRHRRHR